MQLDVISLLESPKYHCLGFDQTSCHFVEMDRDAYQRSIFLDRRAQPVDPRLHSIPLATVLRHLENRESPECGWIFHMAHCGSTLLANLLDQPGTSLVLREPPALRQMGVERVNHHGDEFLRRLKLARDLSGRRYDKVEKPIIKANVPVNFTLSELNRLAPNERAIALYLDWEDYLVAILRSEGHRQWVERISQQFAPLIADRTGPPLPVSLAEKAAALWLAQMLNFRDMLDTNEGAVALNANSLFDRPLDTAAGAAAHLGLVDFDVSQHADKATHYSKDPGRRFTSAERRERVDEDRVRLASELAAAEQWLSQAKSSTGVSGAFIRSLAL